MNRGPSDKRRRKCTYSKKVLYILSEGFIHILRRFCTNFKMRRNYIYSKKVLYILSISQKDLRRCEGSLKDSYTPGLRPFQWKKSNWSNFCKKDIKFQTIIVQALNIIQCKWYCGWSLCDKKQVNDKKNDIL